MKTIRFHLLALVIFFSLSFVDEDPGCRRWSGLWKPAWEDFKGRPPADKNYDAYTFYQVSFSYKIENGTLRVEIKTCFDFDDSWVKEGKATPQLLLHEQKHFDISEIQARKLRQHALRWNGQDDFGKYLNKGNDSIAEICNLMQDTYDYETENSKNAAAQAQWNKKTDSLLRVYKKFESPFLKLSYKAAK